MLAGRFTPQEHLAKLEEETMLKRTVLAAALLTLVATPAFAFECPRLMGERPCTNASQRTRTVCERQPGPMTGGLATLVRLILLFDDRCTG